MHVVGEIKRHGRGMGPTRWAKSSLRSANSQRIPDGTYFLHTDDGKVHQVKCIHGQWVYQPRRREKRHPHGPHQIRNFLDGLSD